MFVYLLTIALVTIVLVGSVIIHMFLVAHRPNIVREVDDQVQERQSTSPLHKAIFW